MTFWHYLSLKFRSLRSQKRLVLLSPAAPDVIGGRGWRNVLMRWQNSARSRGWGSIYRRVEDGRGGLGHAATLRFPSPLIKPDVRISRIRLSDWFHLAAHGGAPRSVSVAEAVGDGRRAQQHRSASV